jgi:Ca-activated chloride channel family protein
VERPPQQAPPLAPAQPLSTRPTQLLTITVTDPHGRYVTGLTPEDFVVYEGEMQQPVSYFNTGQKEPVSLGFLVDMSGSMLTKRAKARQALMSFVRGIKARDEVFLQTFSYHPELLQDFTDSRPLLIQATAQFRPNGKTALYDAILDGLERVQRGQYGKKALIVISDGLDTYSRASLEDTLKAIKNSGVLVYAIGIGSLNRRAQIATSPLGRSFVIGGGPPPLTI